MIIVRKRALVFEENIRWFSKRWCSNISEWLLNDERTGPAASALMGLNMLVESYGCKNYSYAEIVDMLDQAGFKRAERRFLAGPAELVIDTKCKEGRKKNKESKLSII
jgi:hypothetical protein